MQPRARQLQSVTVSWFSWLVQASNSLEDGNSAKVVQSVARAAVRSDYYCELHNNRPTFALFLLFSGAIMQTPPCSE